MKQIKRLGALIVSFVIVLSTIVSASAVSTSDSTVFLKQDTGSTCTLSAAAMMLRRRAILDGSTNWTSITEANLKSTAWVTGQGARLNYTYNGVSVTSKGLKNLFGSKKEYFVSMLSAHPEGIVVYNHSKPHAVLLTDYDATTDTFYCADPSNYAPYGRIKFLDSTIPGDTQDNKINNINQIWYIKSGKTISPITVKISQSGHWAVSIPSHYKLLCYSSADATKNSTYIKAQSGTYVLSCTKTVTLSNGKTRYFFVSGDKKSLWFDYDANYMSVTESPGETSQKQYTVYFDPNGGVVSQTSKTVVAGSVVGSMPTPTREGYTFLGWSTNKNTSGLLLRTGDEMIVEKDTILYAEWKKIQKTYTVNFDANGGSVLQQTKTVMKGSPYGELPMPTYDGFVFLGWFTNKTKITSSTIFDLDRDITLYAQWERENVEPPASTLKVQKISVAVTDKGMMPTYSVTSNYPINHLSISFYDPDGYCITGGSTSFNPDYKIYESNDNGIIYPLCQYMKANRTYRFTIEVGDESGKTVTATATFVMPFSTDRDGKIIP